MLYVLIFSMNMLLYVIDYVLYVSMLYGTIVYIDNSNHYSMIYGIICAI